MPNILGDLNLPEMGAEQIIRAAPRPRRPAQQPAPVREVHPAADLVAAVRAAERRMREEAGDIPIGEMKPKVQKREPAPQGTVAQYLDLPYYSCDVALFGMENEIEGENLPNRINGYSKKEDGSLRGESAEYVFTKPCTYEETLKNIGNLSAALSDCKLDLSFRTSVHTHVNVSGFQKEELVVFLYLAFLFENAIVNYSGDERIGNRFCLRSMDATYKVDEFENFITYNGFRVDDVNRVKYSAINLASIRRFGTVEFRSLHGTVDKKELTEWITILNTLFLASKGYKTCKEVFEEATKLGSEAFGKKVFGETFKSLNYKGFDAEFRIAKSLFINIPFMEIQP